MVPALTAGDRMLISAHGNSLRALLKMLEGLTDDEVVDLNIPTGQPMVLTFNAGLTLVSRRYLSEPSVIEAAMSAVAHPGPSLKAARP